jgi:hypothetical protein
METFGSATLKITLLLNGTSEFYYIVEPTNRKWTTELTLGFRNPLIVAPSLGRHYQKRTSGKSLH